MLFTPELQALVYDILPLEEGAGKRCSECGLLHVSTYVGGASLIAGLKAREHVSDQHHSDTGSVAVCVSGSHYVISPHDSHQSLASNRATSCCSLHLSAYVG